MRTRTIVGPAVAAVGLCCAGALAQTGAIDPAVAKEWFTHAARLSDADGGRLWGRPVGGPMIFVDPATHAAVANRADAQGRLSERDGVFVGALPDEVGASNTSIDWAGVKWTMIMWPLPEGRYARGRLMMHECFHRVQDDLGLPAANPGNNHLDTLQGRIWLQMEWRALSEALIRAGDERRRATEDALVFRARRRGLFGAAAASEERGLEMNEGLSEYTGYRLCGLPEAVLPDRVAIRLGEQQGQSGFVRNFAYVSGPAYGLLLDAARPEWRRGLRSEDDLGELLGAAIGFKVPDDVAAQADRRCEGYDGRRLIARETERDTRRKERLAGYRARFVEGPVLVLALSGDVSYTYDPNGLEAFDESASVYESIRVTDAWGIFEASKGALVRREGGRVAEVRVEAPAVVPGAWVRELSGEGWTLRINEGWGVVKGERERDLVVRSSEHGR